MGFGCVWAAHKQLERFEALFELGLTEVKL